MKFGFSGKKANSTLEFITKGAENTMTGYRIAPV